MKRRANWPIVGAALTALVLPGTGLALDGANSPQLSAEVSAAQTAVPVGRRTDFTVHQRLHAVRRTEPTTAEELTRNVPAGRRTDAVLTRPARVFDRGGTRAALSGVEVQPRIATPQRPMDGGR